MAGSQKKCYYQYCSGVRWYDDKKKDVKDELFKQEKELGQNIEKKMNSIRMKYSSKPLQSSEATQKNPKYASLFNDVKSLKTKSKEEPELRRANTCNKKENVNINIHKTKPKTTIKKEFSDLKDDKNSSEKYNIFIPYIHKFK